MSTTALSLSQIVAAATQSANDEGDLAVRLHNAVRDHIAFGFTPYFDAATPEQTLKLGVGHCNPQARVMVSLFRLAGLKARYQPVTITDAVLRGAVNAVPKLSHVFTEVKRGDHWARLDSYIVDPALRKPAVARLAQEGQRLGYGCHVTATGEWDGVSNSYAQVATPDLIIAEHPTVDEIEDFYNSENYLHRYGPVSFNTLFSPARVFTPLLLPILNARLNAIRADIVA
jgi:hypothetical protein